MKFISIWDSIGETGAPQIDPDHERIDEALAQRVARFLAQAPPVLATQRRDTDVLTGVDNVVPLTFRTDGTWVWSDEVAYYVANHRLSPGRKFLNYFAEIDPDSPIELTDSQIEEALAEIYR